MIDVPVRVKDALKSGMYRKNYRVIVLDKDGITEGTIDNNRLVSESVKLDERMCSGKNLQFGLCEGSSLEFQYFDYENINGKRIKLMLDVEYLDEDGQLAWYEMPMGYFDVDSCPMQFSTGIRKATCYNKLKSAYLDKKMNQDVIDRYSVAGNMTLFDIEDAMLNGFRIGVSKDKFEPWTLGRINYTTETYSEKGYLSADYGIDSPINSYSIADFDKGITFSFYSANYQTMLPNDNYSKLYGVHDTIRVLEQKIYDFIEHLFVNAKLVDSNGNDYWENGLKDFVRANFSNIMCVIDTDMKRYSTIQYEYEKEKKIAHNVAGTINDIADIMQKPVASSDADLLIKVPVEILLNHLLDGSISFNGFNGGSYTYYTNAEKTETVTKSLMNEYALTYDDGAIYQASADEMPIYLYKIYPNSAELKVFNISQMPDYTLRDITTALYAINVSFGKLDRMTDLFAPVQLGNSRLVPSDALYPSNSLYPISNAERSDASSYEKLWTDSAGVQKFRYLIITYKGIVDGQEKDCVLQRTVNDNGTQDYNMSSNWLFKNRVWTEQQVGEYADEMVEKMRDISWFPFEMWSAGLPYLETGDELEITNSEGTYTSYILQRQLNGIQMLKDTYINGELDIF